MRMYIHRGNMYFAACGVVIDVLPRPLDMWRAELSVRSMRPISLMFPVALPSGAAHGHGVARSLRLLTPSWDVQVLMLLTVVDVHVLDPLGGLFVRICLGGAVSRAIRIIEGKILQTSIRIGRALSVASLEAAVRGLVVTVPR
jgi:hypothetical protein